MPYWDAPVEGSPPEHLDFARVWQTAEKIVFSRTLTGATTRNTRVERGFDLEAIRKFKREWAHDINIGGAELAGRSRPRRRMSPVSQPVIVGGGKPAFRSSFPS
jgi:hypothetical protein